MASYFYYFNNGLPRIIDGNSDGIDIPDIGAYEYYYFAPAYNNSDSRRRNLNELFRNIHKTKNKNFKIN